MSDTITIDQVRGKVDFAAIAIRPDEYLSVLDRLPNRKVVIGGKWLYEFATLETVNNHHVSVAVARTAGQGHGNAQQVANKMIKDLQPKWFVLVGIAGGFPNDDFSLGDVVLASQIIDFSVQAGLEGGTTQYTTGGGMNHPDVQRLLSWLPSQATALDDWNSEKKIRLVKPELPLPVDNSDLRLYGEPDHKTKIVKSIRQHFGESRQPKYHDACLGTSNTLVKDTSIVTEFKQIARHVEHIEMEAGGVYLVSHENNIPLLCIRGISDLVGFNRGSEWTEYACNVAASFFIALVKNLPLDAWGHTISERKCSGVAKTVTKSESKGLAEEKVSFVKNIIASVKHTCSGLGSFMQSKIDRGAVPPELVANDGRLELSALRLKMIEVSDFLLVNKLDDDERLLFEIENELFQSFRDNNVTLVLGSPGAGKTHLLSRIGNKLLTEGQAILAIKSDLFPHDLSLAEWAHSELGIEISYFDLVQAIAARESVVVIVDQLDALATTVDLTSSRLNELLAFISNCASLPNVSVICSCREFDFTYDARFKELEPTTYTLDLPDWDQVSNILRRSGITPEHTADKLKQILRTPQHLSVFLKLKQESCTQTFETYSQVLGEFWNTVLVSSADIKAVNGLTSKLVETESIWAPIGSLEISDSAISRLCSIGLFERKNNRLKFSHQTIQEYAIARLFAETESSLSSYVFKHQDTIFKRPIVWSVLNYLRDNSTDDYRIEIAKILDNSPRDHIKFLLIDFICRQHAPTDTEIAIIGELLVHDSMRLRILTGIVNNPAWFEILRHKQLPTIMSDPKLEQNPMVDVLSMAWKFDWDSTFELVKTHWFQHKEFDTKSLAVLEHCGRWSDDVLDLIRMISIRSWG